MLNELVPDVGCGSGGGGCRGNGGGGKAGCQATTAGQWARPYLVAKVTNTQGRNWSSFVCLTYVQADLAGGAPAVSSNYHHLQLAAIYYIH